MGAPLMDASIAAALSAGRSVIVPSAQRAAALRLAWARAQHAAGVQVWSTPEILTWDAWLARQWQQHLTLGRASVPHHRLSRSQERLLWEVVLAELSAAPDADDLRVHAAALMQAAVKAAQGLLDLSRSADSEEETLLADAMVRFRALCEQRRVISLGVAPPEALAFVGTSPPPLIAGQAQLTPLQQRLADQYWPDTPLLASLPATATPSIDFVQAPDLAAEINACANWCLRMLAGEGSRRLLVVSACAEPSLRAQAVLLWRDLSAGTAEQAHGAIDSRLLAVEGGEPLLQHALVADALAALEMMREPLETERLGQVLRSPYLRWMPETQQLGLELELRELALARWSHDKLQQALTRLATACPGSATLAQWLQDLRSMAATSQLASATEWAARFSQCLSMAGFARSRALDSRDAQRLLRWHELLDELAGLDAVAAPMQCHEALVQLQSLAARAVHEMASGDAAITLNADLGDPVASYDGIWVMGLTESRWPEPPRPNPYIALYEQRRAAWPEAGVTQRLAQARWVQDVWRARTPNLCLSYAMQEGDVKHRPSALLQREQPDWIAPDLAITLPARATTADESDMRMPAMRVTDAAQPLRSGMERLRLQQDCPFRSQTQIRLGAVPRATLTDGIGPKLRGMLLHSVLEGLWQELREQRQLLAMDQAQRGALFERHWHKALHAQREQGADYLDSRLLERERLRAARIVARVLDLECQRAPFVVLAQEEALHLSTAAGRIRLRVDRIDELTGGQRVLIDYKSGKPETLRLAQGDLRPLQLALYVTALATTANAVQGAALLSLSPAQLGYVGVASDVELLPGRGKQIPDWETCVDQWRTGLEVLVRGHMQGNALITPSAEACRYCHLDSLCRKVEDAADAAGSDETGFGEAGDELPHE